MGQVRFNFTGERYAVTGASSGMGRQVACELADSGVAKSTVTGYATTIAGKATKVSSATADHLAALTSAGDLADSGIAKTEITAKIPKVTSATANRVAAFVSGGTLKDSGILYTALLTTSHLATDAEMTEVLTEVFGS